MNYRPGRGGITAQVEGLVGALRGEGFMVRIVSTHGPRIRRPLGALAALIRALNADLILAVGAAYRGMVPLVVGSAAGRLARVPVLFNFHDGQAGVYLAQHSRFARAIIGNRAVVTATGYVADAFRYHGLNAVEIPCHFNFSDLPQSRRESNAGDSRVLWARAFEELYQPEVALQAATIALQRNPNVEFHFYGEGPLLAGLQAKYGDGRIVFHGRVDRDALMEVFPRFGVLLNTTAYDNFPHSIVEAGLNDLLVVTTRVGGIADLYRPDEVVFLNESDPRQVADRVLEVVEHPNSFAGHRRRLRAKVLTFTWDRVRADWLRVIGTSMRRVGS
jgi:glycosyltransferase involved in cell wall biosynthesis